MFESIMVRRTNPTSATTMIDFGRLAESMLFYKKVHLALTRSNMHQFVLTLGPDLALELVSSGAVDAVYLDRDFTVINEGVGTPNERHRPATFRIMNTGPGGPVAETRHDLVRNLFSQALEGQPRKARRAANRFLNQLREHTLSIDLQNIGSTEWQREEFMREAIRLALVDIAPGYTTPADLHIAMVDHGDGYFRCENNIDWVALRVAHTAATGKSSDLTPGSLLLLIMEMTGDLHLGAAFDATISQDRLGAQLMRAKCADLRTVADLQQLQIDQFQELVVHGVTDIASVINSGSRTLEEFMTVHAKAKPFRTWLDGQQPDADLVKAYSAEIEKRLKLADSPLIKHFWMLSLAAGAATTLAEPGMAIHLLEESGASVFEQYIIKRYVEGWRPASFVNQRLQPFVNH